MKVWNIFRHNDGDIALNPLPGARRGDFETSAASKEDAMHYILHFAKYVKILGEHVTDNGWHLVAAQYQDADDPFADVFNITWAIDDQDVYKAEAEKRLG